MLSANSAVKWWNEKINENKRSRVLSPAGETFKRILSTNIIPFLFSKSKTQVRFIFGYIGYL
jgi:hypothetical protein